MSNPYVVVAKAEITSSTSTIDLTMDANYDNYYLSFSNIVGSDNQTRLNCKVKVGGTLQTATYSNASLRMVLNGSNFSASGENYNATATQLFRTDVCAFTSGKDSLNGEVFIHHSQDNDRYTLCNGHSEGMDGRAAQEMRMYLIGGGFHADSVISDLHFYLDSGTFESGKIVLYGIANS